MSLYASSSDDIKGLVSRADMILIVPISTVRTEYISGQLDALPSSVPNLFKK